MRKADHHNAKYRPTYPRYSPSDQSVVIGRVVACMCVSCERPFYAELRGRGQWHRCESCGNVIANLVFDCGCTDKPVFAVPPHGRCEYCDAELTRSIDSTALPKLKELLSR